MKWSKCFLLCAIVMLTGCFIQYGTGCTSGGGSGQPDYVTVAERVILRARGMMTVAREQYVSAMAEAQGRGDMAAVDEASRNIAKIDDALIWINGAADSIAASRGDPEAQGRILMQLATELTDDPLLQVVIVTLPIMVEEIRAASQAPDLPAGQVSPGMFRGVPSAAAAGAGPDWFAHSTSAGLVVAANGDGWGVVPSAIAWDGQPCNTPSRAGCSAALWRRLRPGEQVLYREPVRLLACDYRGNRATLIVWAGPCDIDLDGDVGTDADIEAFYVALGEGGGSADFNNDGDVGTDRDIDLFWALLGGADQR